MWRHVYVNLNFFQLEMPSKNRNRRRRQNQKMVKQVKKDAVVTGLRKRELPDVIIDIVVAYKADMESWIVAMDKVMCTFHNIYIQAKAVEGFLLMPEASNIPDIFRHRLAGFLQAFQKVRDKFYTSLDEAEILEREAKEHNVVMAAKAALDIFNDFLEVDERFEKMANLALKAHPFEKFKKSQ